MCDSTARGASLPIDPRPSRPPMIMGIRSMSIVSPVKPNMLKRRTESSRLKPGTCSGVTLRHVMQFAGKGGRANASKEGPVSCSAYIIGGSSSRDAAGTPRG